VTGSLELAERALALCKGEVQVTVTRERSLLSRYARSRPTQATAVDDLTVHILVLRDGQTGGAETNLTTEDALGATFARADAAARAAASAGPGEHPGLPDAPPAYPDQDGWDEATAALDPTVAGAALGRAFAIAAEQGFEAFGIWTAGEVETAIASSTGLRAREVVTDGYMKVICRDGAGRSGWGAGGGSAIAAVDADAIARAAAAKVPRADPAELGPGEYPVVLEHDAVGELLTYLGWLAFDGLAHAEGRGALDGKLGTLVGAPAINLADSPRGPRTLPHAFDFEGVPKQPLPLIQDGIARNVCHDLRSAKLAGARTTGHAIQPGGSPHGAIPTNLVLGGGGAADSAELAAPIERGLYVTRVWYVNPVHAKQTLLTGTTRDGTYLIEDGRVTRPVRDVRFTDSVLRILESTEALTSAQRFVSEADFYGRRFAHGTVCPALRAHGFRVTGVKPA
jgi:predicted Zn-dependent protease